MIGKITENPDPNTMQLYTSQQLAYTYIQLAQREPVLKGAIQSLGLDMDWRSLAGRVSANNVQQTQLLEVSVVDSDPNRAKVLADAIAQQLILLGPGMENKSGIDQGEFTREQIEDLRVKIEDGQSELTRQRQELDAANSARQIQDLQNQVLILESKVSSWLATYSQLLLSYQGGDVNVLSVLEEATVPTFPFSPNVQNNVMVAAMIGFVLAVGGAFLMEYLDDTIKNPDDVSRVTNLPTLGTIPQIVGEEYSEKVIAITQPLSPIVESFRILRTNLQFSTLDRPLRSLLVTSPGQHVENILPVKVDRGEG
jgi:non-specific protein-tyrosine kinase